MHERSLVRALIHQVNDLLTTRECGVVTEVVVSLGEFSGVDARLFALAFDDLKEGTRLGSSRLVTEEVRLEGQCDQCGNAFAIERFRFVCPSCGHTRITILRGEELVLESLTIEPVVAEEVRHG